MMAWCGWEKCAQTRPPTNKEGTDRALRGTQVLKRHCSVESHLEGTQPTYLKERWFKVDGLLNPQRDDKRAVERWRRAHNSPPTIRGTRNMEEAKPLMTCCACAKKLLTRSLALHSLTASRYGCHATRHAPSAKPKSGWCQQCRQLFLLRI